LHTSKLAIYFCSDQVNSKSDAKNRYLYGAYQDKPMAYAIIEIGGQQIRVEPNRFYDVNRLTGEVDSQFTVDRVLFVNNEGDISIGAPVVEGATVEATVMRHMRGRKVLVYKMKPKKKTRKKRGHRQELTRFLVNSINLNGTAIAAEPATKD
jgi:large subunit ribosomal protein L21